MTKIHCKGLRATLRPRILLTIPDFVGSGAVRELRNLACQLSRSGFEPHVCIWRRVFDFPPLADVPLHLVRKTRTWHGITAIHGFARLVRELQPAVVFTQTHYQSIIGGTALALLPDPPAWICRLTNNPYYEIPFPMSVWARWALPRANRVAGCSRGVCQALAAFLRLAPERIVELTNLVDLEQIASQSREVSAVRKRAARFTIVHAGRFHRQKNQEMLLEAFARFRGRPADLWLLGKGPRESRLRRRAEQLRIADQIRWLGFESNPYPIYREADCFALSSLYEGLPNALIESLTCGTPVVSTAAAFGPDEIVRHGIDGLLTPLDDVTSFADALQTLADSPHLRSSMSQAAPSRMRERFAIEATLESYVQLIRKVAAEHDSPRHGARCETTFPRAAMDDLRETIQSATVE